MKRPLSSNKSKSNTIKKPRTNAGLASKTRTRARARRSSKTRVRARRSSKTRARLSSSLTPIYTVTPYEIPSGLSSKPSPKELIDVPITYINARDNEKELKTFLEDISTKNPKTKDIIIDHACDNAINSAYFIDYMKDKITDVWYRKYDGKIVSILCGEVIDDYFYTELVCMNFKQYDTDYSKIVTKINILNYVESEVRRKIQQKDPAFVNIKHMGLRAASSGLIPYYERLGYKRVEHDCPNDEENKKNYMKNKKKANKIKNRNNMVVMRTSIDKPRLHCDDTIYNELVNNERIKQKPSHVVITEEEAIELVNITLNSYAELKKLRTDYEKEYNDINKKSISPKLKKSEKNKLEKLYRNKLTDVNPKINNSYYIIEFKNGKLNVESGCYFNEGWWMSKCLTTYPQ